MQLVPRNEAGLDLHEIDALLRQHAGETEEHLEVVPLGVDLQKADPVDLVLGAERIAGNDVDVLDRFEARAISDDFVHRHARHGGDAAPLRRQPHRDAEAFCAREGIGFRESAERRADLLEIRRHRLE